MAGKPKYQVELEGVIASLTARIEALEARPVAEAAPVKSEIRQNGKLVTNRMMSTLVRLGDFESFEAARAGALAGFPVAKRLDEWSTCFKAMGLKSISCKFCSEGVHSTSEEARACAMASAK